MRASATSHGSSMSRTGADREDVDDPAVAPEATVESARVRRRAAARSPCAPRGRCACPDTFGVRGTRPGSSRCSRSVRTRGSPARPRVRLAEQAAVRRLDPIAADDPGEAAGETGTQPREGGPIDVDVVVGAQPEGEVGDLGGRDPGGEWEPEQRRTRAQRHHRGDDAALLERSARPDHRRQRTAAAGREQCNAPPRQLSERRRIEGRERVPVLRRPAVHRQGRQCPASDVHEAQIVDEIPGELPSPGRECRSTGGAERRRGARPACFDRPPLRRGPVEPTVPKHSVRVEAPPG